ncbi:hypothetical protein MFIFM68171_03262 [Madurella fahalii]|uniref:Uncharacterized protein n=1 Tax=Madurella fahalii TaxID=1157608 RepID=A0ABQ0G5P1_9PEZI
MAQTPKKNAAAPAGEDSAGGQATINGHVPSALEANFVFALIGNFKSKPEFDWDKIAAAAGLTKKSAQERWRLFRIKYGITMPEGPASTPGRKNKTSIIPFLSPSVPSGRDDQDDNKKNEDAAAGPSTVTPKKKATPARKTPVKGKKAAAAAAAAATPTKKRGATEAVAGGSDNEKEEPVKKKGKGKEAAKPAAAEAEDEDVPMDTSSELSPVPSNLSDEEM